MKKTMLLFGIGLLAGGLLGLPYYAGLQVEKQLYLEMEKFQQPGVEYRIQEYQRRWFDSTVTVTASVDSGEGPVELVFDNWISHGPRSASLELAEVVTTLRAPEGYAEEFRQLFGETPAFEAVTRVGLDGSQTSRFSMPAIVDRPLPGKAETRLNWQGLKGAAYANASLDRVSISLEMGELSLNGTDVSMQLGVMGVESEMEEAADQLWLGESRLTLAGFELQAADEPHQLALEQLVVSARQKGDSDLLNSALTLEAKSLAIDGERYGPHAMTIAINNLDAGVVQQLNRRLLELRQAPVSEEEQAQRLAVTMLDALPELLARQPELALSRLQVETPEGKLEARLRIAYEGDAGTVTLDNPMAMVPYLQAGGELDIAEPLLHRLLREQIRSNLEQQLVLLDMQMSEEEIAQEVETSLQQQLGGWLSQGLLEQREGQLHSSFSFAEGQLTINDVPSGAHGTPGIVEKEEGKVLK